MTQPSSQHDEPKPAGDWVLNQDEPIARHMRQIIAQKGLTPEDVVECIIHVFLYEGPPTQNGWRTYERTGLCCYRLFFRGETPPHNQYWHWRRHEPLTSEQARQALEQKRLMYTDQHFLETVL